MTRDELAHIVRSASRIPDNEKADKVDGAIGEDSQFHATFGYYGQGVSVTTAVLPAGCASGATSRC